MLPDNLSTDAPVEKSSVQVEHFFNVDSTPDNDNVDVQDAPIIDDPPVVVDLSVAEHSSPVVQPPQHFIAVDRARRAPKPVKRLKKECNVAYALSVAEEIEGVAEPSNYSEAITSADCNNWLTAMQDEMESLEKNGTWDLVKLPKDKKNLSVANGFSKERKLCLQVSQQGIKQGWLLKAIVRFQVLISMMSFPQL